MKNNIIKDIKMYEDRLIEYRRNLHQIPEIGLHTPKTSEYIKSVLKKNDIPYKSFLDGNSIVVVLDTGKDGKCLGIRADMDALEVVEETELEFKSTNGNMHACGHDAHMAILLTTLLIINDNLDKFKGKIKFIFQPGEEYPGGAKLLIEEGVLENPKVDAIIGLHVGNIISEVKHGCIGVKNGNLMASMDKFSIEILGKGGHGSTPEDTIDPIPAMCDIVHGINNIRSREIPSNELAVISVCKVQAGSNQNTIPSKVEIEGTVRTYNDDVRSLIKERIGDIAKYYSKANRCEYSYEYSWKYPFLSNDESITDMLRSSVVEVLGEEDLYEIGSMSMAGEDMAYYLKEVPGTFFTLSNLKADIEGNTYPNHSSKFDIDESLLWKGVAVFIQFAIDFLN